MNRFFFDLWIFLTTCSHRLEAVFDMTPVQFSCLSEYQGPLLPQNAQISFLIFSDTLSSGLVHGLHQGFQLDIWPLPGPWRCDSEFIYFIFTSYFEFWPKDRSTSCMSNDRIIIGDRRAPTKHSRFLSIFWYYLKVGSFRPFWAKNNFFHFFSRFFVIFWCILKVRSLFASHNSDPKIIFMIFFLDFLSFFGAIEKLAHYSRPKIIFRIFSRFFGVIQKLAHFSLQKILN